MSGNYYVTFRGLHSIRSARSIIINLRTKKIFFADHLIFGSHQRLLTKANPLVPFQDLKWSEDGDAEIPLLEAVADGPVRAGETLDLSATPLFEATEVSVQSPLGDVQLTEVEPGQYAAKLPIAASAEDAVYDLLFRAARRDGTVVEQTRRVRVLNTL